MCDSARPIGLGAIFTYLTCTKGLCAVVVERNARIAILAEHEVGLAADDHHEATQVELSIIYQKRVR